MVGKRFKHFTNDIKSTIDVCMHYFPSIFAIFMYEPVTVKVEHVFAQLKAFKILTNTFALDKKRLSTCYRAVAVAHNMNLEAKNAGIPKF